MIGSLDRSGRRGACIPSDPEAFIVEAERITNQRDARAVMSVYGSLPVLEFVTEGALERHVGATEVLAAWTTLFDVFEGAGILISKTLIAAGDGVIVNGWESVADSTSAIRGLEVWAFDESGDVERHLAHTFLQVKPASSWHAQARVAFSSPRLALALMSTRRRNRVTA